MSKTTKNQMEAATAYYKAECEQKDFAGLTNEQVAQKLSKRLGWKLSENSARNIRRSLGLPTRKRVEVRASTKDASDDIKTLAKTQSEITNIIISMLNRSPGYDQPAKEAMLRNLDSIKNRTENIARTSKKRRTCVLGPRGTALKLAKNLREEGKTDQEIRDILKTEYIKVGLKGWEAVKRAKNIVKHTLNRE